MSKEINLNIRRDYIVLKMTTDKGECFELVEPQATESLMNTSGYFEVYHNDERIAYCHIHHASRRGLIDEAIDMYFKAVRLKCYELGDI